MSVPQERNQKKTKRNRNTDSPRSRRVFRLDAPRPTFQDWLENERLDEMTFEEVMLFDAEQRRQFYDRPKSFLPSENEEYDSDIGNDLDDFIDFANWE